VKGIRKVTIPGGEKVPILGQGTYRRGGVPLRETLASEPADLR